MRFKQTKFNGGIAGSSKIGYPNSYNDGYGGDPRTDPDILAPLKQLKKDSGTTIVGKVKWQVEYNGYTFMYDVSGNLYRRTNVGVWSLWTTVGNSHGQGLEIFNSLNNDALWYARDLHIGRVTGLTGGGVFDNNYIETIGQDRDFKQDLGIASAYNIPTAISEAAVDKVTWFPTKHTLQHFVTYIGAHSGRDLTVTIHDKNNVLVVSKTVVSGSVIDSADNDFDFPINTYVTPGAEYHAHITASGTLATVGVGTANDFSTSRSYTRYRVLDSENDYCPMKVFLNFLAIGNTRYLATLDDTESYNGERLVFPVGERVRCLEVVGGNLAIATWRGSTISDYGTSHLYLWDGVSQTYTDIHELDGQIHAMKSYNNRLYVVHGAQAQLSIYDGDVYPLRRLKSLPLGSTAEVMPGAMTVWNNLLYFGFSNGTSNSIEYVIYAWGRYDRDYAEILTKDYPISTGVTDSTMQITSMAGINPSKFLISWYDGVNYGVDNIDTTKSQATMYVSLLREDAGESALMKDSKGVAVYFKALESGQSIEVLYRLDNSGSFTSLGTASTVGQNSLYFPNLNRNHEIEYKVIVTGDGTKTPDLYSIEYEQEINNNLEGAYNGGIA